MIPSKTVYSNLLSIKGIGSLTALRFCAYLGISPYTLYTDLTSYHLDKLLHSLASLRNLTEPSNKFNPIENNLDKYKKSFIVRLITNRSYRGSRISQSYPARGQRTRSNSNTVTRIKHIKIT